MMQEIMRQVVADVAGYAPTEHSNRDIPVIGEYGFCEFPEWYCKRKEEGGWHNEAHFVHWEIVVDAM